MNIPDLGFRDIKPVNKICKYSLNFLLYFGNFLFIITRSLNVC